MDNSLLNSEDYEKMPVAPANEEIKQILLRSLRAAEADLVGAAIAVRCIERGLLRDMCRNATSDIARYAEECRAFKTLLDIIVIPTVEKKKHV
jgi:hypothetical protein